MKTISTSITITANPSQVWQQLVDFPAHEEWNPFFASIEGEAIVGSTIVVTARKGDGTGMSFRPTVLVADAGRELRWLGKLGFGHLFDGEHSFVLTDNGDGTTTLDHGEQFRGLLIPFMGKVLRDTEAGFHEFNTALQRRVETALGRHRDCAAQ